MYADIVVLTYQPPEIDSYTYEVPKDLEKIIKPGQLVSVPFGKRNPAGIVFNTIPGISNFKFQISNLKEITSIILAQPLLLPYQIQLLKWLSFYYHAPMVNCLEAMLPKLPNAKRLTTNAEKLESVQRSAFSVQQTLVLVSTINQLPETLAQYPQAKNYAVYHNELNASKRFQTWLKIKNGDADFIFGSRSAIFAPCPNLSKIVIIDEHKGVYKDERSPYFDTLTVAEKLQELTKCKIEIVDATPKVTTYFNHKEDILMSSRAKRGDLKIEIATPSTPRNDKKAKVQIVSMLTEKAAGNKSPISDILKTYIKLGYQKNKRILLFLNKKNEGGHVYCKTCKFSGFAQKQPNVCPNCGSADIWFNTLNVNSLASLIQKIIPSAKINIVASNNAHPGEVKTHPMGVLNNEAIVIATAAVFYKLLPQKYDLVAHIRTDSILATLDYTSTEHLYSQIIDLKKITRGLLLLQTYNPENETLIAAASGDYLNFYNNQLPMRKTLLYPPYALLVKLSLKGKKGDKVQQKAEKLYEGLKLSIVNSSPHGEAGQLSTVSILGPYGSSFSPKISKYNIILKMPVSNYALSTREKALAQLVIYLKQVPKDWQIIVEPASIN